MLTIAASSVLRVVLFAIIVFMLFCVVFPVSYLLHQQQMTSTIYCCIISVIVIHSCKIPVFLLFLPIAVVFMLQ